MGATVSNGQSVGAGDKHRAAECVGNTVTLFMVLAAALTAGLLVSVRGIVAAVSTPEAAVEGTVRYLTVCFIGIPFITADNIISSILRGLGDSKSPMYFIAAACVTNIVLDFVFMGALGLGPVGAALGTTLSQAVSVGIALLYLRRTGGVALTRASFRRAAMSWGSFSLSACLSRFRTDLSRSRSSSSRS